MSESENKSGQEYQDSPIQESLTIDPKKAAGQYLWALSKLGVATLPKGAGEYAFDFAETEPAPDASSSAPSSVAESKTDLASSASAATSSAVGQPANSPPKTSAAPASRPNSAASAPAAAASMTEPYGPLVAAADREGQLNILRTEVEACTQCELCKSRKRTVFGLGNVNPRLVFIGEGPGADEDRVGEPFVGAAGKLLDKIINACKIQREDVFILNIVKCRPPGNRNPSAEEQEQCWEFLERQLDILQPEFICCLGSVAAKRVLNTTLSLGRMRQKFYQYRGSRVLVTYHPAYLLRTESAKKLVWEDMKLLMKEMGIDLSK